MDDEIWGSGMILAVTLAGDWQQAAPLVGDGVVNRPACTGAWNLESLD